MYSAWHIGAREISDQDHLIIDGHDEPMTGGTFYLYHPGAPALSLLDAVVAHMTLCSVAGAGAGIQRDRKVRLYADNDFTLDWPADNVLRDLLGFTENLSGSDRYTADLISPLFWSPGRQEMSMKSPPGSLGHYLPNTHFARPPYGGRGKAIQKGSGVITNEFRFPNVLAARYQTKDEKGGEWAVFHREVMAKAASWHIWRNVDESDASTALAVFGDHIGPYQIEPDRRGADWTFARSPGFEYLDRQYPVPYTCRVVLEYPEP